MIELSNHWGPWLTHSVRSAFIGASAAAPVAGITAATNAVNVKAPAATVSATGLGLLTPSRHDGLL